ncbi:unnamed protein product [Acanthoscelides obtectus]|uniref:DDE Tnp4 domain-containing protein n=1 Tax=Acanthoscelides obtectus TaxID=200917 RepID=A0A9P0K254_ACAOB|nr:unnamed protein product [Acanthoscelides obtectus]CAK1657146.1 Putative nuclease HARBI1 [Acanthoscelides obtectus]
MRLVRNFSNPKVEMAVRYGEEPNYSAFVISDISDSRVKSWMRLPGARSSRIARCLDTWKIVFWSGGLDFSQVTKLLMFQIVVLRIDTLDRLIAFSICFTIRCLVIISARAGSFPKCQEDWKEIADLFEARWNFPHCLGAIDGKHIDIIPPAGSGSEFFNYKGRHSMVLLGIANAKYQFILADFGTNGRISNGGVLQNTKFFEMLTKGDLRIPTEEYVKGNGRNLPYVFVADDAFALRSDMMKPFRQADLNSNEKKIFNYRLSRARRIIENTFRILAARFRIFHTQINVEPENIIKIVMAAVVLHNFLIENSPKSYAPKQCVQEENADGTVINYGYNTQNSSMENLEQRNPGNINDTAKNAFILSGNKTVCVRNWARLRLQHDLFSGRYPPEAKDLILQEFEDDSTTSTRKAAADPGLSPWKRSQCSTTFEPNNIKCSWISIKPIAHVLLLTEAKSYLTTPQNIIAKKK